MHELASGSDSWWGLGGQSKTEPFHEKSLIWIWLGVTAQDQGSTIVGREMNIEHLDAGELIEHGARGETRRQRFELRSQGDVQAVGHEGDEPGLQGCNASGRYRMKICASMRLSS